MAKNVGFAELLCVALPPSGTYSVSFRFYAIARLDYLLSFFRFFLEKFMRSEAEQTTTGNGNEKSE